MADDAASSDPPQAPLWRYIPLEQFERPSSLTSEGVRKGFLGMLERMRRRQPDESAVINQDTLSRLSADQLDRVVPAPEWKEPVAALSEALDAWLSSDLPPRGRGSW